MKLKRLWQHVSNSPTVSSDYEGVERRHYIEPIHPMRWRLLTVWILTFTVAVAISLHSISNDSATVKQLQHTNCGLKKFLLVARYARFQTALHEKGKLRATDLAAARGYDHLASSFTDRAVGNCHIAPKFLTPIPKR